MTISKLFELSTKEQKNYLTYFCVYRMNIMSRDRFEKRRAIRGKVPVYHAPQPVRPLQLEECTFTHFAFAECNEWSARCSRFVQVFTLPIRRLHTLHSDGLRFPFRLRQFSILTLDYLKKCGKIVSFPVLSHTFNRIVKFIKNPTFSLSSSSHYVNVT